MKSSSLLSTFSSFSSGTAVVKTNTPNTAAANLKAALAAAATNPTTSTTPPQSVTNTTSKLTTNALINLNNNVNNGTTATTTNTALPINLKISLKMELLPNEKLYPTPSMQDGLLFEDEFDLRLIGCELIQTAGRLLKLPQTAMATGQVLFHRFFYSKSFVKNQMEHYAMASIFLSSKIEECPRRIRDVMNVFHHIKLVRTGKLIKPMQIDQSYSDTKNQVIKAERRILKELGFCVHVKHPHKIIFIYLRAMEATQLDLSQKAWNYMNDSLRTDIFLRYSPENIVCACIYLSARELNIPLPQQPPWYTIFGADEESLKAISVRILHLYSHETKSQEELEKAVEACREKMNEEKRRTREASSILAAANQKTLQMTGDKLIAEKISQLKSNESSSNLLLQAVAANEAKSKTTTTTTNNGETKSSKSTKGSSHSSSKHSSSPSSHHHHHSSTKHSSILNTHPTNPYHLNNTHHNSNNIHMSRSANFNYNYYSSHHHPPHYPPNIAPPPHGYYPGPDYFNQYPDAEAFYNENSFYDISLRKNKSSSSLRNPGDIIDYQIIKSHRYPGEHHRSSKSSNRRSRSRSRSDQSRSRSPSSESKAQPLPSGPGRRMPSHVAKLSGRLERKRSTRSRSRSMDSVDSSSEKRRSRSPSSHSKSKKKKSHHHTHSRKEEVANEAAEKIERHHHKSSKEKSEKDNKGEHRRQKSGTHDKEKRSSSSSHHKSKEHSSSKSKEHSSKDRPSNNSNTGSDSRYIPIYS